MQQHALILNYYSCEVFVNFPKTTKIDIMSHFATKPFKQNNTVMINISSYFVMLKKERKEDVESSGRDVLFCSIKIN